MQNILEKELFKSVEANTPEYVKKPLLPDFHNPKEFTFRLKREHLLPFDERKNPEGLNLNRWLENYAKEAAVSTAGIRGPQNILYPHDTRFPINVIGIILATKAKALNALKKYPGKKLLKLAGREVRYNSQLFLDLIARVQAASGIETLVTSKGQTMPIWMASFLAFKLDLAGAEYITSSHGISVKNATKDLNSQGSQYLPEESKEFVDEIKAIFKEVEEKGFYDIKIADETDSLINKEFMKRINDGIDLYAEYLKNGVANEENLNSIKNLKDKIVIENVGGSAHETLSKLLDKLGISEHFDWLNTEEDPFFHSIGKYDVDPKGNKTFYDYSVDATVIAKDKDGKPYFPVIKSMKYDEKLKDYPLNTFVLITDPDHDRLTVCRIESASEKDKLKKAGADFTDLSEDRILTVLTANQAFLLITDFWAKQLRNSGKFDNHERFMIKTTASAKSWDEWAKHNNIEVINVPVGFKEIASIMKKVEKQLNEGRENVVITDIFGKEHNLGKSPRLIFGGEESGGMIIGAEEPILSKAGRKAIAMREKSATEAIITASALASELNAQNKSLADALTEMFDENSIISRFDIREDISYYNESEPDINKLNAAKKEGEQKRTENDLFFLSVAVAKQQGKLTVENAREIFGETFPQLDFSGLEDVMFVGDGTYLLFNDKFIEIRPSGTDAKTKAYGAGRDKSDIAEFAKTLGNYPGTPTETWKKYITEDLYKNAKDSANKIYEEFTLKDADNGLFEIPDYTKTIKL